MKVKLLALAVTSLISVNAMAVTIDYRHEMKDTPKNDHRDRLSMSHRFANGFGLSVEAKWKQSGSDSTPNKPFNETVSNGTEVVASYVYNFNKTFSLEPGFSLDSTSDSNNYRPYLRGKVNITDDLSTSLRYRPYYKRNSGKIANTKGDPTQENGYNLTAVLSYKFLKDYQIDYELDYQKANKAGAYKYDNETYNFNHDVKLSYKFDKNWKPYMAVGNVADSGTNDHRQTRYRVGVQYSF
ncbi:oligogalacturonate-specific porin KdgM family protein [Pectobacterium versatile]|uniref:oligogalacturonate-specific porin KdgM family protein n=1 Tax=Pectobacterium versatile TaxID=2488639 RepID=UPI001CE0F9FA|nr:oligogalacturonate-specific porin KdgM family protein [Pectobacterium versatile]GKW34839.1 porin [Pectobacterium carotovorum subsp. carotovorum]MCA5930513.1 oligogalacturonate-specific porin KdgM family protein [Pectobacterium versatile]MCA5947889.1 oligogalacturonate-specific porin KdgM family protein [Pectobacterium versatile]MCA5952786.1 oligogalacturonate-specific porin KdgM family protein [Pectobacterium versatile]UCP85825.1 oligogalacturonate-specific porin KdgM family protein [Pectob